MKVTVKAAAKVNLSLDIVGQRRDGYHLLESVMQSVDLCDTLVLTESEEGITLSCNWDSVPLGEENLCFKAAREFCNAAEIPFDGFHIKLKKKIPLAAGLGGGSADAAAVLMALNQWFDCPFSSEALLEIGARIGADVPFCLMGGTVLAEGTGNLLTPLPTVSGGYLVLAKKGEKCSTADAYEQLDRLTIQQHPQVQNQVNAFCSGEAEAGMRLCQNVFSPLWESENQVMADIMHKHGALAVTVTGSGPTLFSVFMDEGLANRCASELRDIAEEVYVCEPISYGCVVDD